MTAYEELKNWCEKHLPNYKWTDTLASRRHSGAQDAIEIDGEFTFIFTDDGKFDMIDYA